MSTPTTPGQLPTITASQAKEACKRLMGLHISKDLKDIYRSGWVNLNTDTLTVAIAYSDGKDNPAVVGQILVAAPSMLAALIATLEWIDKPEMHDALKLAVTNAINKATK